MIKNVCKHKTTIAHALKKTNLFFIENKSKNFIDNKLIFESFKELMKHDNNNNLSIQNISEAENESSLRIYLDYLTSNDLENIIPEYDVRILLGKEDDEIKIAERIKEILSRDQEFISTRGSCCKKSDGTEPYLLYEVIRCGLAEDKGLFVPKSLAKLDESQWKRLINMSYSERCLHILENFPLGELKPKDLRKAINEAYSTFTDERVLPIIKLKANECKSNPLPQYIMEEYWGPSASFKDLALQLFPRLFKEAIKDFKEKIAILVATSGDTGSAVLSGFKETGIPIIVLYPYGKVSQIQEAQMITAEGNVKVFGVRGDFDFCQNAVKSIFNDKEYTKLLNEKFNLNLSSANSINWARLLPQVFYSIHSYLELIRTGEITFGTKVDFCIPSGNFGNILGAFIAKKMGLPIDKLICASNENNILTDFINTGEFDLRERSLKFTSSPAIDILNPSNIERLLYFLTNDAGKVKSYFDQLAENKYFKIDDEIKSLIEMDFLADFCNEEESLSMIKHVYENTGYIIDPHTAVAKVIADKMTKQKKTNNPILIAATAHYAKFPETVMKALNIPQGNSLKETVKNLKKINTQSLFHKNLEDIMDKKILHEEVLESDLTEIKKRIFELGDLL